MNKTEKANLFWLLLVTFNTVVIGIELATGHNIGLNAVLFPINLFLMQSYFNKLKPKEEN